MNQCGGCTLCCKIEKIPEIAKASNHWCEHCSVGIGCSIYSHRPTGCAKFQCGWLASELPAELRPDRAHFYIASKPSDPVVTIKVDPDFPDAWKGHEAIEGLLTRGKHLIIAVGHQITFLPARDRPAPEAITLQWTL